jgi:predicted RND superfamily exporter protein
MFGRLTAWLLSHRALSTLLVLVLVLAPSAGVAWLGADFSTRSFFGLNDPEAAYLTGYLERWGEDDMLIVIVDGGEDGLLTHARLKEVDAFAARLAEIQGVKKVLSLTAANRPNRVPGGMHVPVPLISTVPRPGEDGTVDATRLADWQARTLADPQLVPVFLSANGRYGTIMAALSVDTSDLTEVRPVVHAVEDLIQGVAAEAPQGGGVRFQVAGVPAIRADILDVIVHDQILLVPISGTAMGLLLLIMFRSRHGVMIPAIAAAVPTVMLLGIMGWTGEDFNLLNQSFLALVPAMSVANAIHLVSRYHEESRRLSDHTDTFTAAQQVQAIVDASEHIGMACFLTTFTTVIGFLALLQTDMPVLRGFGVYSAVGVVVSYLTLITIVPLMLLWTRRTARRVEHGTEGVLGGILERAGNVATRHPWHPLIFAAVVAVVAMWWGSWVKVNSRLTETYEEGHPTTVANRILDEHLAGILSFDWEIEGPPGTFERPEVLQAMEAFEVSAVAREEVKVGVSPATLARGASVLMGGPARVPADAETIRTLFNLAQDRGLAAFVNEDRSRARLLLRVTDVGAVDFLALGDVLDAELKATLQPLSLTSVHQTGSSFVTYRGLSRVTVDLRNSLMTSFGVIGVVIALLFRNVWLGVLSLIPNTLPQIFGYGVMGLFGWTLEPAPAVVYTIAVGVSVDSAIHIIARFNEELSTGASIDDSVRAAIYSAGRAVMITELMLAFGFLVNVYSASPATQSFGKLGAVIILLGPPSNLFVLPSLLKLWMTGVRKVSPTSA